MDTLDYRELKREYWQRAREIERENIAKVVNEARLIADKAREIREDETILD